MTTPTPEPAMDDIELPELGWSFWCNKCGKSGPANRQQFMNAENPLHGIVHEGCGYLGVAIKDTHYTADQVRAAIAADRARGGDGSAKLLSSLLARIHRDGGHHEADHGTEPSVRAADRKVLAWLARDNEDSTRPSPAPETREGLSEEQRELARTLPARDGMLGSPIADHGAPTLEWTVQQWRNEVQHRPLENVHRRFLDAHWRSLIRRCHGDPDELVGPDHDALRGYTPMPMHKASPGPDPAATPAAPSPAQPAQEPVAWEGRLPDTLQKSLNALYLECPEAVVREHSYHVRSAFEAICTSLATTQRMFKALQAKVSVDDGGTAAPAATQPAPEPDMRHPKVQALIGSNARKNIELQLVEQLIDDPDCDLTAMDMEYWNGLHDKLREALMRTQPAEAKLDKPAQAGGGES